MLFVHCNFMIGNDLYSILLKIQHWLWQEDLRNDPGKVLDDLTIVSQHNSLNGELLGQVMIRYSHLLLMSVLDQ
jgi:hypothetical protein